MKGFTKKIAFIFLYIRLFTKRHAHFLVSGFIVGFLVTLFLLKFYPLLKSSLFPNIRIIGMIGNYNSSNLPLSVQRLISLGLTTLDDEGKPLPSLASSWEATNSGKVYVFHIKPNILWHDGKILNASDIKFNLRETQITALDPLTLKIVLKDAFSPLPVVLSRPIIRKDFIGVGIYKVKSIKYKGDSISTLTLEPLKENLPLLEYKFYSSLDDALLAFKLGEINTLQDIQSKDPFVNWKNANIIEVTQHDRFLGVFFNTKDDILKDKETRQALTFAIPPFLNTERVYTPISPSSWAYYNKVRIYKYDIDNAQKMLEKTALSTTSAEIRLSTYAPYLPYAQKIAESWNSIGVKTKIKVETTLPFDYQAILLAQEIPADPDQYQFWHSNQMATNISRYTSLKIDNLLETGRKEMDIEKRKKTYADFQRYLVDDDPVAFLFFPKVYTIERK